jgi:hypothetical protein
MLNKSRMKTVKIQDRNRETSYPLTADGGIR